MKASEYLGESLEKDVEKIKEELRNDLLQFRPKLVREVLVRILGHRRISTVNVFGLALAVGVLKRFPEDIYSAIRAVDGLLGVGFGGVEPCLGDSDVSPAAEESRKTPFATGYITPKGSTIPYKGSYSGPAGGRGRRVGQAQGDLDLPLDAIGQSILRRPA